MIKEIERSPKFIHQINKIDGSKLPQVQKLILKIINDPEIGKPMRFDRKGTREVYVKPFRISYAYDNQKDILYLLDVYHKDEQ